MAESAAGAEEVVFVLFFLFFRRRRDILQFPFHFMSVIFRSAAVVVLPPHYIATSSRLRLGEGKYKSN